VCALRCGHVGGIFGVCIKVWVQKVCACVCVRVCACVCVRACEIPFF
jgi:hypothetical protein